VPALSKEPDTVVLVHGFWVTPRSWEHWITRYEAKGYRVLAPAYPGFAVYEQWRYVFTNMFEEADARAAYDRYHVPASGGIFWDSVLANFIPGPQDIAVDYHNDARPPLLFISGSEDHLMPTAVQRSNAKHYKSNTITEIKEFPGRSHLMPAQQGWEEIADYALAWAEEHATNRRQTSPPPA
jgi:pimeloyl-ACP methyl ester carboxylesterase